MPAIANPTLLAVGLVLFLIGLWCWRWSSRNAIDLKGAAVSAAWQSARSGKLPDIPDDMKAKYREIADETSNVRRAQKAGGTVARHFMAKVMGIAGLVGMLGGLALGAAGIWWK
jgi:hypothetical protein